MEEKINQSFPTSYSKILSATQDLGFTMASEIMTCSLLRTLAASKPSGKFLELGTGTGLSTSWILDGMDTQSSLISVDNETTYLDVTRKFLGDDKRLELIASDGEAWVMSNKHRRFDYIFADTWHGKYLLLEEVLTMLNTGGLYIIDDMLPQSNWPEGHHEKAVNLVKYLDSRNDLWLVKQAWASGVIVAVKR